MFGHYWWVPPLLVLLLPLARRALTRWTRKQTNATGQQSEPIWTVPIRAERPGVLPSPADAARWAVGGVALPPGRLVCSTPAEGEEPRPLAWVSETPVSEARELWLRLATVFDQTGLWPLASKGLDGEISRPWLASEQFDEPGDVDAVDALAFLRESLGDESPDPETERQPVSITFAEKTQSPQTGLPITGHWIEPDSLILLVPVTRPADAWNATGWEGTLCNHSVTTAQTSAVLRSWEDRFGAVITNLGFDTIDVEVANPPTKDQLLAVAAEHYAFCPDIVDQGIGDLNAYAEMLEDCPGWPFWWD